MAEAGTWGPGVLVVALTAFPSLSVQRPVPPPISGASRFWGHHVSGASPGSHLLLRRSGEAAAESWRGPPGEEGGQTVWWGLSYPASPRWREAPGAQIVQPRPAALTYSAHRGWAKVTSDGVEKSEVGWGGDRGGWKVEHSSTSTCMEWEVELAGMFTCM